MVLGLAAAILAEIVLFIGALLVLFVIFTLGRFIIGIIINIILGFIGIVAVNALFGIGIPWDLPVIILTALFGLVGVAIVVVLKLLGVMI
jgi:hypothetical protein